MRLPSKLGFAGLVAAVALLVTADTASAGRLSVTETGFEIAWNTVTLLTTASEPIRCGVTLSGRFEEATFVKRAGAVGRVTHAGIWRACTGGTATILRETLPWSVNYASFTGTLPEIRTVRLSVVGFSARGHPEGSIECLLRTTATHPLVGEASVGIGGEFTTYRIDEFQTIPLRGEFLCELAGEAIARGEGQIQVPGTVASVRIRLI